MKTKHRNQIVKLPPEKAQALHRAMKPVFRQFATYPHTQSQQFTIEPENAGLALAQPADPLWSFLLAHALDLAGGPLSYWFGDRLGQLTYDREALLVLEALQDRQDQKRKGDLYGTLV